MCDRWDSQRSLLSYMTVGIPTVIFLHSKEECDHWASNGHILIKNRQEEGDTCQGEREIHGERRERYRRERNEEGGI